MTKSSNLPTLEESLSEITQLIDNMEHTDLSLEQSLSKFERGITLVKHCQQLLSAAEQKVQVLLQTNQHEELAAFTGDKDDEPKSNDENSV